MTTLSRTLTDLGTRARIELDGRWQFWTDAGCTLSAERLPEADGLEVAVPAPWQSQSGDLRFYTGVAWYRRTLEVPHGWLNGGRAVLAFGAVDYLAEVWLNGVHVGSHEGGYLPFEFDVTGALQPGANTLTVRVDDPGDRFAEVPHGKQSWYGPLSGIWQPVWLERRPETHILSARITPHEDKVDVAVTLNRPLTRDQFLALEIAGPDGVVCSRATSQMVDARLQVPSPLLWSADSPNLYTLRAALLSGYDPGCTDTFADTFGFRTVETRNGQILINGQPIYLRAALDQDYYPDLIGTQPSLEYVEDEFRKAKAMGLNCVRVHIKVADPRYYIAADRVGLLLWTELPNWSVLTEAASQRGRETMQGMIARDWNHPSIVIWTIINEGWGLELPNNPDDRAWLQGMYAWVKSLDPTRLVVDNSPCPPNFHVGGDLADFHFYAAMPDQTGIWDEWMQLYSRRSPFIYGPEGAPPQDSAPLIVSEFGNWGLPDVAPLIEHYGGEPWWFETGWEWEGGEVYPHGARERLRLYHLDRVFGNYAGLAWSSQWAQFEALKYQIESMRLHGNITGYVITELTDVHWEANGLLDMLRNPKAYGMALADINADTVIVPRVRRYAYWSDETVRVELQLSHFGNLPIKDARLEWSLASVAATPVVGALAGEQSSIAAQPAQVAALEPLGLRAPQVSAPARLCLQLVLRDAGGAILARNTLDLAVFPRAGVAPLRRLVCRDQALRERLSAAGYAVAPEGEGLPVLTHLDEADRRWLQQGGRAIFLAEAPSALETAIPRLQLVARAKTPWQGDWASSFAWYRRDRFARQMPGDGRLDFTCSAVLPETVISGPALRDFENDVLAGLFVGWLRKPAALTQRISVSRGELLVCTLRLKDNICSDPVAAYLFDELVAQMP